MPPFGTDGIRRFPPNVAEMRQRAARHFEDILQVIHGGYLCHKHANCNLSSALSQHLRVSSRLNTTLLSEYCYSVSLNGMPSRSFDSIPMTPWLGWTALLDSWQIKFASSSAKPALHSQHESSRVRQLHDSDDN